MRRQCPDCRSFNDPEAAFCAQCGRGLDPRIARRGTRLTPLRLLGATVLLLAGVLYLAWAPEEPEGPGSTEVVEVPAVPEAPAPLDEPAPEVRTEPAGSLAVQTEEPLEKGELERLAGQSLVVLELEGSEGRPLRDVRGVLVREDGVVLTRFRPLLGAYRGACRILAGGGPRKVDVLGVSYYDELHDLALLRVGIDEPAGAVPILDAPPASALRPGDELWVQSGHRLKPAVVSEPRHVTREGLTGVLLAEEPRVVPETFLALEETGELVGLCRPLVDGRLVEDESVVSDDYVVFVDPAYSLARHVDLPVVATLSQLTAQVYEGTFEDLAVRAERARRREDWRRAIDLYALALERAAVDEAPAGRIEAVRSALRESTIREIRRLMAGERHAEAAALASAALQRSPGDSTLWSLLADSSLAMERFREGIDALLEARAAGSGTPIDGRLETAYRAFASRLASDGEPRRAEAIYLEAVSRLPRSGTLHMDLAKLYQDWEAYDEAIRWFHAAREVDRSLADQVEVYLQRIDDILKQRDAVVIPIPPGSSQIRATVTADGRWELPFIIDTGASHTTIPARFAETMGYDVEEGDPVRLNTAGGTIIGHRIRLVSLDLEGYAVRNIDVIVLPPTVSLDVGLLGINFLKFFKYGVDTRRGEFRLERQ